MLIKKRMPRYRRKQMRRRKVARRGGLRAGRYHGLKFLKETILKTQITLSAAQAQYVRKFACSFMEISQNPGYQGVSANTAIPALFGRYCITGVKWTFIPNFTQSTQGGTGAARVCYAMNRDPQDVLTGESDVIRQDDVKFTNTTRKFSVYVKHPKPALAATANFVLPVANPTGMSASQYQDPLAGGQVPNQVAWTTGNNKWIWLPTRTVRQTDLSGNISSDQYPDHLGLDVVITPPVAPTETVTYYNVYQTLYLALKEQD